MDCGSMLHSDCKQLAAPCLAYRRLSIESATNSVPVNPKHKLDCTTVAYGKLQQPLAVIACKNHQLLPLLLCSAEGHRPAHTVAEQQPGAYALETCKADTGANTSDTAAA